MSFDGTFSGSFTNVIPGQFLEISFNSNGFGIADPDLPLGRGLQYFEIQFKLFGDYELYAINPWGNELNPWNMYEGAYYNFSTGWTQFEPGVRDVEWNTDVQFRYILPADVSSLRYEITYSYWIREFVPAVPEPNTYTILGLGLGLLGFAARNKRKLK
ncbi:PEP-CTERM sorting domain-containing protein [Methylobacillus arboreus]|uniref:PEP-CTERM sorting domain-containing protein n=1 Tax=Methylobacillus arboreus TaxID=755170 RepID=UPI001E4FF9B0|nr:PEP-CTERM sorting domain-containing protein [Methylobacillus arboreus]MCB5189674.1 PEP-CTERM sorting domain-containing protein [Methylobacillus arboreus]